jgi:hypothetical protein
MTKVIVIKQHGTILTYNAAKLIGTLITSDQRRFFYHQNQILAGPAEPKPGDRALFIASTKAVVPGRLPVAREIEILEEPKAGQDALADTVKAADAEIGDTEAK